MALKRVLMISAIYAGKDGESCRECGLVQHLNNPQSLERAKRTEEFVGFTYSLGS